jgi:predicted ATP-dependent serine protease
MRALNVVGGVSSLGKTTYILQMADKLQKVAKRAYISLEMAIDELIAKSISRYTASAEVRVN